MQIKFQVAQIDANGVLTMLPEQHNEYKDAEHAIFYTLPPGNYQVQKVYIKL